MKNNELLKFAEGIPNKKREKKRAQGYYEAIGRELKKVSKEDAFGHNFKAVYLVDMVVDKECDDDNKNPNYRIYVNGTNDKNLQVLIDKAIQQFIDKGDYFFHYFNNQLQSELPRIIVNYLKENISKDEYWCRLLFQGLTALGKTAYHFMVLRFDKIGLENNISYDRKRHPFLNALKREWSYGEVNDINNEIICYNELFRRAATNSEYFIYLYENAFNALSALKYENESNKGSILALRATKDKPYKALKINYEVAIYFEQAIKIEYISYKKIRKLLEITGEKLSLLMNENNEIFAIGKMIEVPSCDYYQVCFEGFLKWTLYKNNEKFLCFENMIPRVPDKGSGICEDDIELLKKTFKISDTSKHENIIKEATLQRHGTMVVFAENASDEAKRLKESGLCIKPIDISTGLLVEAATAIDGAIICDAGGICYAIGTVLDGRTTKKADSSRGARYNSAIRYIQQQKKIKKKTFIVVVSEDGYTNCFSTFKCKK